MEFTVVVFMNPLFDFGGTQLPVGLDEGALAVRPLGLNRVQPRGLDRQVADPNRAAALALHPAVVRPGPTPYPLADMPGGIVPDRDGHALPLGRESLAQPTQEVLGHLADRPAFHETQQHRPRATNRSSIAPVSARGRP